ncbi:MAG: homocysteine S-methyltransferase family protein [Mycobacterium sp.]
MVGATAGRCSAVGVNRCAPDDVLPAIGIARATDKLDKPVIVYPNSGDRWDGRAWTGRSRISVGSAAQRVSAGARIVGGCCRVGPPDIAGIAALAALGR